jgi:hypothetical protein
MATRWSSPIKKFRLMNIDALEMDQPCTRGGRGYQCGVATKRLQKSFVYLLFRPAASSGRGASGAESAVNKSTNPILRSTPIERVSKQGYA